MAEMTIEDKLARDSSMVLLYGWAANLAAKGMASLEQDGENVIVSCESSVSDVFGFMKSPDSNLPELQVPEVISDFFFAVPWVHARLREEPIYLLELACGVVGLEQFKLIFLLPLDKSHVDSVKSASMLSMVELSPDSDDPQNRYVIMTA